MLDVLYRTSEGLLSRLFTKKTSASSSSSSSSFQSVNDMMMMMKQNTKSFETPSSTSSSLASSSSSSSSSSWSYLYTMSMALSCLAIYNIRWKHLIPLLLGQQEEPRVLPYHKVEADHDGNNKNNKMVVVLLHGMWNDASYFQEWQDYLADGGYTSYAIELMPGERWLPGGLLRQEMVRDLEFTLSQILSADETFVLMGHSRGGVVVQGALQCSPTIRRNAAGAILLASYPLGYIPSLWTLWKQQRQNGIFHDMMGALKILLFGKLRNKEYTKRIFLLPNANERSPKIAKYLRSSVQAPSDGALYCCWHSPSPPPMPDIPALIVGAQHDVLIPPLLVQDAFLERFPNSSQIIIPHQAHAFRDGGWQLSMVEPLVDWLDSIRDDTITTKRQAKQDGDGAEWSQRVLEERKSYPAR